MLSPNHFEAITAEAGYLAAAGGDRSLPSSAPAWFDARMTDSATHRAIDAVWRIESARLIAGLARMVRDVDRAEELAQGAARRRKRVELVGQPGAFIQRLLPIGETGIVIQFLEIATIRNFPVWK